MIFYAKRFCYFWPLALCGAALFCLPVTAHAQTQAAQKNTKTDHNTIVTVVYENDMIGDGSDGEYTNGVRLSYFDLHADIPRFAHYLDDLIPTFEINDTSSIFYSIGHNMFTPPDISQNPPDPQQRPYAGFLYGSVAMVTLNESHLDEIELTLGVVGPASMAENVQKFVHRHITDSPMPKGWRMQLKNEPGIMLAWQRSHPFAAQGELGPLYWSAAPHYGVTLGNIYTFAHGGFSLRLQPDNGALQDTPVRIRPAMPGSGYFEIPENKLNWHLFAGVDGRAVARNIFLDGNTFTDSPSVDKYPLVLDSNAGIALTYDKYRISYTLTHRTKEYTKQKNSTLFGAISLGVRF